MKKIIIFLFCTLLIVPSFVSAHTSLSSSNPSEGQVVTEDLEQIILTFGTSIEELSTMDLLKDGNKIPLEGIKVENKQLAGTIAKPLDNGSYIILWTIVGEDGHPIKGEINFIVQMENAIEENPVTPEESEANQKDDSQNDQIEQKNENQNTASDKVEKTDDQNNDSSSTMLITVIIILIVIVGIVLLLFTGKKRRKS